MLGYLADKALIFGLMWSVSWCLSLCLGSMATGPCSQHMNTDIMFAYLQIFTNIGILE